MNEYVLQEFFSSLTLISPDTSHISSRDSVFSTPDQNSVWLFEKTAKNSAYIP